MRIRTLLENQDKTPGWDTLDYLVCSSFAQDAPTITITNWNQSTCYANTSASDSRLKHKNQDIPLKLEMVYLDLYAYWHTSNAILTDNLGVEHPFSYYSTTSGGKNYFICASDYGAEYFNKVQLSASGLNGKAIQIRANQLGWKPDWDSDYDAEIEYLESTGTQWIDLKVNNIQSISGTDYIEIWTMLSAHNTSLKRNFAASIGSSSLNHYLEYNTSALGWWPGGTLDKKIDINQNVFYETVLKVYPSYAEISVNSQTIKTTRYQSSTDIRPVYLFALPYDATYLSNGIKLGATKVIYNGNTMRDFIPVRKGQVGYMYDKVSGQLFGNSGTGSFILGPDK